MSCTLLTWRDLSRGSGEEGEGLGGRGARGESWFASKSPIMVDGLNAIFPP